MKLLAVGDDLEVTLSDIANCDDWGEAEFVAWMFNLKRTPESLYIAVDTMEGQDEI